MKLKSAALVFALVNLNVFALPERPAIERDVHMTQGLANDDNTGPRPTYTRPYIPPLQTSFDARIGMSHKPQGNGRVALRLLKPEKFGDRTAFVNRQAGTDILDFPDAYVPAATRTQRNVTMDLGNGIGTETVTVITGASIANNILNRVGGSNSSHNGLCDPTFDSSHPRKNPFACPNDNSHDCYDLVMIRGGEDEIIRDTDDDEPTETRYLVGIPIRVEVDNPKTSNAHIERVIVRENAVIDNSELPNNSGHFFANGFLEPNVAGDGRLLFLRVNAGTEVRYRSDVVSNNGTRRQISQLSDNVYLYNEAHDDENPNNDFAACDVRQWTRDTIRPLSHAPYDNSLNEKFGFAMQPFRDPKNNVLQEDQPLGTYPWIDKNADNISITSIGLNLLQPGGAATEANQSSGRSNNGLIPLEDNQIRCVQGVDCTRDPNNQQQGGENNADTSQNGGLLMGRMIAGLWTRGKMVLLDDIINNIDYTLEGSDTEQREVQFYEPGPGPGNLDDGFLRIGNGRENNEDVMPFASSGNTTFIDSNEHRFNYFSNVMKPITPEDVVWLMSSGRGTTEVSFDDYTNPNSFILANMNFALSIRPSGLREINVGEIQNAATGGRTLLNNQGRQELSNQEWQIPTHGELLFNTRETRNRNNSLLRVETVANGGVEGKGLWLETPGDGIRFNIPEQPRELEGRLVNGNWYYGLYIDQRNRGSGGDKRLIEFPDGSLIAIRQVGDDDVLVFTDNTGTVTYRINEPVRHDRTGNQTTNGWMHLGFQIDNRGSGTTVIVMVNGYPVNRFTRSTPAFNMRENASITIGTGNANTQFEGWIDDFKVFAQAFNPEVACNLANGTLVGFDTVTASTQVWGEWDNTAGNFGRNRVHTAVTRDTDTNGFSNYACFHDYTADYAAHLGNIPSNFTSVRENINFPEGPLRYDRPRPNSTANSFCLSCHVDNVTSFQGLTVSALDTHPQNVDAINDPRRQPLQPEPFVYGVIPANWLRNFNDNAGGNAATIATANAPFCIDQFDLQGSASADCGTLAGLGETTTPNNPPENNGNTDSSDTPTLTLIGRSNNWANNPARAIDGRNGNEARSQVRGNEPADRVYVDVDLGGTFNNLVFTLRETNDNPHQVLRWRIRRMNTNGSFTNLSSGFELAPSNINTIALESNVDASQVRIEFIAPNNQLVGVQEVSVSGIPN